MNVRDSLSSTSGTHGEPYGAPSDFCQECARLNVCPISWHAVQNFIRFTNAVGFGSLAGGGSLMNELAKIAHPCRCAAPRSSNMIPPRPWPWSDSPAKNVHTCHCGTSAHFVQWACIASCISRSDHLLSLA